MLLDADHMCCVCRVPRADIQILHIDRDRSNSERSNLAIGRRLTARHIRHLRDTWLLSGVSGVGRPRLVSLTDGVVDGGRVAYACVLAAAQLSALGG